jgi:hypothetical protein
LSNVRGAIHIRNRYLGIFTPGEFRLPGVFTNVELTRPCVSMDPVPPLHPPVVAYATPEPQNKDSRTNLGANASPNPPPPNPPL